MTSSSILYTFYFLSQAILKVILQTKIIITKTLYKWGIICKFYSLYLRIDYVKLICKVIQL